MAAMARFLGSTRRMGTQSAVWTPRRRPGRLVAEASPLQGSWGAALIRWMTSEWICLREMSWRSLAPRADWKRRRLSRTFSRVSQSVKPRFNTFSPSRSETPPGLVLKPWMSQGSLFRAGTWRIWRPRDFRVIQAESDWAEGTGTDRNVCPTLRALRLGFSVFVGATAI